MHREITRVVELCTDTEVLKVPELCRYNSVSTAKRHPCVAFAAILPPPLYVFTSAGGAVTSYLTYRLCFEDGINVCYSQVL